jgi:hypothetical protein
MAGELTRKRIAIIATDGVAIIATDGVAPADTFEVDGRVADATAC